MASACRGPGPLDVTRNISTRDDAAVEAPLDGAATGGERAPPRAQRLNNSARGDSVKDMRTPKDSVAPWERVTFRCEPSTDEVLPFKILLVA